MQRRVWLARALTSLLWASLLEAWDAPGTLGKLRFEGLLDYDSEISQFEDPQFMRVTDSCGWPVGLGPAPAGREAWRTVGPGAGGSGSSLSSCLVHRAQAGHLMAFPGSASAVLSLVRSWSVCGEGGSLRAGLPVRGFWAGPVWLLDLILLWPGLSLL